MTLSMEAGSGPAAGLAGATPWPPSHGFLLDLATGTSSTAGSLGRLVDAAAATFTDLIQADVDCAARLVAGHRRPLLAASSTRAAFLAAQEKYDGGGPLMQAAAGMSPVSVSDERLDPRWPGYVHQLRARGYRAVLAFPLVLSPGMSGSLAFFGRDHHHFTPTVLREAARFVDVGSRSLQLAVDSRRLRAVRAAGK